jgi:hypothetical protein
MQHSEIENQNIIIDYFGDWPSFHDFEIQRLVLDRGEVVNGDDPSLYIQVVGSRGKESPAYPNRGDCIIELRFESIENVRLAGFNHQNAINDIDIQRVQEILKVKFLGAYGVDGEFECKTVRVESLKLR